MGLLSYSFSHSVFWLENLSHLHLKLSLIGIAYCHITVFWLFFLIVPLYFFFACSLWFDFLWWYTYIPFSLFFVYLLWVFALWLSWGLPITTFIYEFVLNWWQLKFDTIVKLNIIPMFLMSHFTSLSCVSLN